MNFSNVVGQKHVKEQLWQMLAHDRLPHALLFIGPAGCGHLPLALAFAQMALCDAPTGAGGCGHCIACRKTEKLIHPDLHFAFPAVGANVTSDAFLPQWRRALLDNPYLSVDEWLQLIGAENRQGNINKEECVGIIRKLSLKTFEADRKVMLMWLPEYLGKEGNRLLKIIEEPPEKTLFLFIAEQPELILNTILSRCQTVKCPPLSDAEVAEGLLGAGRVNSREAAAGIAALADGDYNEALRLAEQKENDNARLFLDWLRKCYRGNGVAMVKWVEQFATLGREKQKHLLRYGLHFFREYLLLKVVGDGHRSRLGAGELETARKLTPLIEVDQVEKINTQLNECIFHVERNANPKILFLDASVRINQILKRREPKPEPGAGHS